MANYSGNLKAEFISRWERKLLEDFIYTDKEIGPILVNKDYVTDFASVRALRIWLTPIYATLVGYGNGAATIHDALYEAQEHDRKTCDQVFFRALRDEGTALWRSYIFYYGIRLTGWKAYNDCKKAKTAN